MYLVCEGSEFDISGAADLLCMGRFSNICIKCGNELNGMVAGRTSSWASDEKTKNVDDKKAKIKVINKIFMMLLIVYWNKSEYQLLM